MENFHILTDSNLLKNILCTGLIKTYERYTRNMLEHSLEFIMQSNQKKNIQKLNFVLYKNELRIFDA